MKDLKYYQDIVDGIVNEVWNALPENLKGSDTPPSIRWRRMGYRVSGRDYPVQRLVEFNINYIYSPDWEDEFRDTVLHELAHQITWDVFHECSHNNLFYRIVEQLGGSPHRCHTMRTPTNRPPKRMYRGTCECGHIFTITPRKYGMRFHRMCCGCENNLGRITWKEVMI